MNGEIKVTELNQMITETQNKIDWYSVEIKQIDTDYETAN